MKVTKVGILGCGMVFAMYMPTLSKLFPNVKVVACADIDEDKAEEAAEDYDLKQMSIDELIDDPEIEIIMNLTPPQAHTELNLRILEAGKHLYCEKPLAPNLEEAKMVLDRAKELNLRVGGAPDIFLSAPVQTCRRLIDDGKIGKVINAVFSMAHPGPEQFHNSPFFFYKEGGGPVMDLGPYFLSATVALFGPVKRISCVTRQTYAERTVISYPHAGKKIDVEVPTFYTGILEYSSGAVCTMIMSWDTLLSTLPDFEIHGTEASVIMPNPGLWTGEPYMLTKERYAEVFEKNKFIPYFLPQNDRMNLFEKVNMPYCKPTGKYGGFLGADFRGWGLADMASAIEQGRPHRTSPEFIYHLLEIEVGLEQSAKTGQPYEMTSTCERPEVIPEYLPIGETD